jgi:hypothetical protein
LTKQDEITKGAYRYVKYPGDTFHGGEHWHVSDRRTGKLLGRMTNTGEVLTGAVPKTALKIFKNVMRIGGIVLGVVLELADPADAGGPKDMLPLEPIEPKKCH